MVRLRRLGRVLDPAHGPGWMASHAAYPTPVRLADGRLRLFFVSRDTEGRGQVGWADVADDDPTRVTALSPRPVLATGEAGGFGERGWSPGNGLVRDGALHLYLMGWNAGGAAPFRNAIGLAVDPCGTGDALALAHRGPLLDRSRFDPYSLSYPHVSPPDPAGGPWRMIYGTHRGPGTHERTMRHTLSEALSDDGIDWRPIGADLLALEPGELGHSRPWIFEHGGERWLAFSVRRAAYAIGLARWTGAAWERRGDLLGPGEAPWEDEAVCYAAFADTPRGTVCFYCANGYGRTGFGAALVEAG